MELKFQRFINKIMGSHVMMEKKHIRYVNLLVYLIILVLGIACFMDAFFWVNHAYHIPSWAMSVMSFGVILMIIVLKSLVIENWRLKNGKN